MSTNAKVVYFCQKKSSEVAYFGESLSDAYTRFCNDEGAESINYLEFFQATKVKVEMKLVPIPAIKKD